MPLLASVPVDHPALARRIHHWADRDQTHKAVMSLFREDLPGPQEYRRATAGILYRIEQPLGRILLQSAVPPARTDYGIRTTDLAGLAAHLSPGQAVRFRVDVNAVRCQSHTARRIPVPDCDLPAWLTTKLQPALANIAVLDAPITVTNAGQHPLRIAHVTGTATVNNHEAAIDLIESGIGRAKAYGCGLLTLLPTH
jgi:CRISPR system Cascade subunit CasE